MPKTIERCRRSYACHVFGRFGECPRSCYGFRTFVANRVGEIQSAARNEEWYWTPGDLNIADYVTRGKHPDDQKEGSLWQTGPKFLELPMDQ